MHVLHAAYASSAVFDFLSKTEHTYVRDLAELHSHFAVDTDLSVDCDKADPLFLVADNIISRGLPTLAPLSLEKHLAAACGLTRFEIDRRTGSIRVVFSNAGVHFTNRLAQAFCIPFWGKPTLQREENGTFAAAEYGEGEADDGTAIKEEQDFLEHLLPKFSKSGAYFATHCERQTSLSALSDEVPQGPGIAAQSCDFTLSFLGQQDSKGLIIEIDGSQHDDDDQKAKDAARDDFAKKNGWSTVRLPTRLNDDEKLKVFEKALTVVWKREKEKSLQGQPTHCATFVSLIEQPFFLPGTSTATELDSHVLDLVYLPIAAARICKVLIRLLCTGRLSLDAKEWRIGIVERDIKCAQVSVDIFRELMARLFACEGKSRSLPRISCETIPAKSGTPPDFTRENIFAPPDVLLDFSVIAKYDLKLKPVLIGDCQPIRVRSVYRVSSPRKLLFTPHPVEYPGLDSRANVLLKPFLRDMFRKLTFRPKQVDIIRRTLRGDGTVALLPTGSGKSLTYQLSALLQPGCVLVVAPLKSLMRDQRRSLLAIGIDGALFINSSLSVKEREQAQKAFSDGRAMFAFISPERFVIQEFRDYLAEMKKHGVFVSFVAIDEAHCVSEWGHDFRTAYLRLGANARKHVMSQCDPLPILALTGTASYDVLTDVQRELGFAQNDDSCLIYPAKSERPELHYEVLNVDCTADENDTPFQASVKVSASKLDKLASLLDGLPDKVRSHQKDAISHVTIQDYLSSETENAGLIFCTYKSKKQALSTVNIADFLKSKYPAIKDRIGFFNGTDDAALATAMERVQDQFMNGTLSLLAVTKAFGMGIDKPTIRFTVHTNYPQSIEGFAQEAGRAGRDRRPAVCSVIFSPARTDPKAATFDKKSMLSFHKNSFPGLERDRLVLWDLLDTIRYPSPNNASVLSRMVKDELDLDVNLHPFKAKFIYINYLQDDADTGDNSRFVVSQHWLDLDPDKMTKEQIESVQAIILRELPDGVDLMDWLNQPAAKVKTPAADGFEIMLGQMSAGQEHDIMISAENDVAEEVASYIKEKGIHPDLTDVDVKRMARFIRTEEPDLTAYGKAFVKSLASAKSVNKKLLTDIHKDAIASKIIHLRTESDTYKAVYRLCCAGVIRDYTILYGGSLTQIRARIRRTQDIDYIESVKDHIGRYVSKQERELIPERIMERAQDSILKNCLDYLLNFTYTHIAEKRRVAIDNMEDAVVAGVGDPKAFAEQINTYFDSKYLPELHPFAQTDDETLIWRFLDKVKGRPDEAKHLRGACRRLLESYPNSGVLQILLSYSSLALATSPTTSTGIVTALYRGFELFESNVSKRKALIGQFIEELAKHNEDSADVVAVECVTAHLKWLSIFSNRYKKGITYGNQGA